MEMQEAWQALRHHLQNVCHEWGMSIIEYPKLLYLTHNKWDGKGHVDFDIRLLENRITVTEIVWLSPVLRKEPKNIEVLWDKVKEAIKEVLRRSGDGWYYFEMPNEYAAFSNHILGEYESMNPV